jgi:hypothetical protein
MEGFGRLDQQRIYRLAVMLEAVVFIRITS